MKEMRRVLALLLCFVMLVGVLPVGALATGDESATETTTVTSEPAAESSEVTETSSEASEEPSELSESEEESTEAPEESSEATEESTEATEESTEATEESTEATEESTEATEESTEATEESTEATEESTEATEESTEATEESTEATEESTEATEESTEATEETIEETTEPTEEEVIQEDDGILQILVGSDYTEGMGSVLSQIQAAYTDIDTMMFLGGYTDVNALVTEAGEYYAFDNETILVQGAQDEMNDLFGWSGNHDTDSYGAFVINEEEYEIGVADILSILESYLSEKVAAGYDKPIFVLSYRPLHYGSGNADARALFDILNKAGAEGLTIVYVYGQNADTYVGDGAVYLPVGDQIFVAESETYVEEALTFTYMNAGASSDNMAVFTFIDGEEPVVSVTRYDAEGVCLLKNEGIEDELMVADTTIYESPAIIEITAPAEPVVESESDTLELTKAADGTIYILAGGDFQEAGDHANSANNVTNILAQVSQKYTTMDGFLFIGDYDCETHNDFTETANGITALMGAVQGSYSNLTDANSVLVQGNHDYMDSRIDATGGHDFEGYAAYVLNEDDYPNYGGSQSGVQTLANNLKTWLNNKIGEGYDAPIFIVSHLPLAFTPRTVTQGDAKYAKYIFDVLNDAGEEGLNIIFLHGHDHAYGPDNYMGGEAIYLAEGDKINIAEAGSQSKWTQETLNFTYMNAGYTGYYSDAFTYNTTAGTDKLTMTVFAITDNEVTVERYSEDGLYNMKSAGRNGSYSDTSVTADSLGLAYNTTVYASPQTIDLTTPERYTVTDEATGVTVTSKYTEAELGLSVTGGVTVSALADTSKYTAYKAYTISATADVSGDPANITIPVPTDYPLDGTIVYLVNGNTLTEVEADITMVAGAKVATFYTTEPGTYAVAVKTGAAAETKTEYVRVESISDLVSGEQYLIVFDCSSQDTTDRYVIPTVVTSNSRTGFDVVDAAGITDNATITVSDTLANYEFTLTQSGSGWYIAAPNGQRAVLNLSSSTSRGEITLTNAGEVFTIAAASGPSDANSYSFRISEPNSNLSWDYNTNETLIYADDNHDNYQSRFVFYKKTTTTNGGTTAPEGTTGNYVEVEGKTTYTYELATSITGSESYVIVGSDDAVAFMNNNNSIDTQNVTISGNTLTSETELDEWTFSATNNATISNGGRYLRRNNNTLQINTNSTSWTISNQNYSGEYRIYNNNRYLYYTGSTFGLQQTNSNQPTVRLYQYDETVTTPDGYAIAEGEKLYAVNASATAEQALAAVKNGITVSTATNASGAGKTAVVDNDVTWTWVDTFQAGVEGYYTVEIEYGGVSLGTVEVQVVDSHEGTNNGWVGVETDGSYQYVLDTDGINYGLENGYLIVARDSERAMDDTGAGSVSVDISNNNTITVDTRDYEWSFVDHDDYVTITKDGVNHLYHENYGLHLGTNDNGYWTVVNQSLTNGRYRFSNADGGTTWYVYYSSGDSDFRVRSSSSNSDVRLYAYRPNPNQYAIIEGKTRYNVTAGTMTENQILAMVQKGITGYLADDTNGTNKTPLVDGDLTWTWVDDIDPNSEGYYTMSISYMGKELGTVEVFVEKKAVSHYSVEPTVGYVSQNASQAAVVKDASGDPIYVTTHYVDGSTSTVPLTVSMLSRAGAQIDTTAAGTRDGLSVTYGKYQITSDFTLHILERQVNNYPEYPDEGAVKVGKTATGIDFQSSGIAQVELSASGVPVKKGADVILMLDTSSSMTSHTVTGTNKTRAAVLEESLEDLIVQFKTPGDDGELLDIRVAIADFNGFYGANQSVSGTPYDRDAADTMSDDIYYDAASEAKVYTGDGTLGAGAFIDAADLAATYTLNYTSGTNYDYAMDAIYQLGAAIKQQNSDNNEERDLYVIFMSDGAAMQWNYYHSQGASSLWNSWITGSWATDDLDLACTDHAYYYNDVDTDGDGMRNEHRMANAIKGNPADDFTVIRKSTAGLTGVIKETGTTTDNLYLVPGLGATMFSISFDAQADDEVTEESMDLSIETLASNQTGTTQYYYKVTSADELSNAFKVIGTEIAYAATNARFVDQMGDDFNLQLSTSTYTVVENGETVSKRLAPVIEILTYDIYTRDDYEKGRIEESQIGDRKGTYTLNEVVKFSEDGTKAYSNLIDVDKDGIYGVIVNSDGTYTISDSDDNIIGTDGVIYARTFMYNTGILAVTVSGTTLESEQFYWKMGTIATSELAMRYYVYLEGSMEGTAEAGSYATNEYAVLYYDNYLGNPCEKPTTSPTMAWKSANVSYAFYLVDENGNIIVNQTTGQTGSFANKIAVTNPVVYEEILLNNTDQIQAIDVRAMDDDVLPKYYELYDEGAVYKVTINSNSTGSWEITKGDVNVASTYVTQYKTDDASAYSNALTNNTVGDDYTHTVVWFAVVWSLNAHPDTVVVDYGLPVDISVLTNDMFGDYGKLAGIGAYTDKLEEITAGENVQDGFGDTYIGKYGTATADEENGKVRYTLNTMQMDSYEKFAYAVNYTGAQNAGYYYDTITVIPATTIYYEDNFLTYGQSNTEWVNEGTAVEGATQGEDRPGKYSLTDANNIYGYDGINLGMSTFSLGTAKKVTVNKDSWATAEFTFKGTGFDVIGMTSSDTGVLLIEVTDADGNVQRKTVDTYYGVSYVLCNVEYRSIDTDGDGVGEWHEYVQGQAAAGAVETPVDIAEPGEIGEVRSGVLYKWIATPHENALYQVPVIEFSDLEYGQYTVKLIASYFDVLNNVGDSSYDLYLDAIRIYDPANDGAADGTSDTTIEDAYKVDGEGWPSYIELRNQLIAANSFDDVANDALTTDMEGLVFIDGDTEVGNAQISDYISYGPNNEVYLAPGQRVAFLLSDVTRVNEEGKTVSIVDNVHIGIKSADGATGTYTITNVAQAADEENNVEAGQYYNARTDTVNTTTDMYYDLTSWKGDIIVISNTGDRYGTTGVISLTNIKSTYTSDPNGLSVASAEFEVNSNETYVYVTPAAVTMTLRSLNAVEPEESTPGSGTPEESEPEATVPEETAAETTVPEETEPETTVPEETESENRQEQVREFVKTVVETVTNVLKNLFGGWFR